MNKNPFFWVLKNKDFRNLWLGQITSQIALNMLIFILGIRVYQQTSSNASVSLLYLAVGIPAIIFGVLAGGFVDDYEKKHIMVLCNFVRFLIFLCFFIFSTHLTTLYILIILFSITTQFFIPAEAPSIPVLVRSNLLLTANSLFTVSFYLSTVTGFVISGPMMKIFGTTNIYLFMAALMFLATFFVSRIPKIGVKKSNHFSFTQIGQSIDEGLIFIKKNDRIYQSLILMTFAQALIMTLSVVSPGFADKVLHIDLTDASYLIMGPSVLGLIFGAFLIGDYGRKVLKGVLILGGIIFSGVVLIFLSLLSVKTFSFAYITLGIVMLLLFLLGFFNSLISVPANTILQLESEGEMRGRVYGVLTSLTGGISILPVVLSGILADVIGVSRTLSILGVVVISIGIYHYLKRKVLNIKIN